MKIAILHQSDAASADAIRTPLLAAGNDCTLHESAKALLDDLLRSGVCDLLIVDTPITRSDNVELLREVKAATGGSLPVLLMVDGDATSELIEAIDAGLDDYLIKPVRRVDLLTRVDVLLRRAWPDKMAAAQLRVGAFVFDTLAGNVTRDGKRVALTQKEFGIALLFFRHIGQPLSRVTLLEAIWSQDGEATSRTVDTHVSRVRTKLGLLVDSGFRLAPVYGYGYLLERVEG